MLRRTLHCKWMNEIFVSVERHYDKIIVFLEFKYFKITNCLFNFKIKKKNLIMKLKITCAISN